MLRVHKAMQAVAYMQQCLQFSMDWQRSHLPITQAQLIRAGIGCTMGMEYVTPRPDIAHVQGDEPILYGCDFPF